MNLTTLVGIALLCVVAARSGWADEFEIVFDPRPEFGLPAEAAAQERGRRVPEPMEEKGTDAAEVPEPPKLHELAAGAIKRVRIRYFNKETWATEDDARAYVRGFLSQEKSTAHGTQMWSQIVGMPEIECLIDFTDAHRAKLRERHRDLREGRLVLWNTECCFRDATGRWWFVGAFDHFHAAHPKGTRSLAKP